LIAIIRQFHLQERRAFQRAVKCRRAGCRLARRPTRNHTGRAYGQSAQSVAEFLDLDTRAYMLDRLSLDFVTQQQQHKDREGISSAFTLPIEWSSSTMIS
jgi:hypothetical protein